MSANEFRSCYDCTKSRMCYIFINVQRTLSELPEEKLGVKAPGRKDEVFESLAQACVEFQKIKAGKIENHT